MWVEAGSGERFAPDILAERLGRLNAQTVVLEGPTRCGKSQLIKWILKHSKRPVRVLTSETLRACDTLIEQTEGCDVLCIEDVDMLRGSAFAQMAAGQTLRAIAADKLVILSGIDCAARVPLMLKYLKPALRVFRFEGEREPE